MHYSFHHRDGPKIFLRQIFGDLRPVYSSGPRNFCHLDTFHGTSPYVLPYDISLLVGSDRITDVQSYFYLAVSHSLNLLEAHQPTIFNEIVPMTGRTTRVFTQTISSCQKFVIPALVPVLVKSIPTSQSILFLDNVELSCTFYVVDQTTGQGNFKATLKILPIIERQTFALREGLKNGRT